MIDDYSDILGDSDDTDDGTSFTMTINFRIIDNGSGFSVEIHKLLKRSFKGYEHYVDKIMKNNPIDISDVYNVELNDFRINKLYRGEFIVNYYNNDAYDIFLKNSYII